MSGEQICGPHYRRTGKRVQAVRVVDNEGMCLACFKGKPVRETEERTVLPWFLAEALNGSRSAIERTRKAAGSLGEGGRSMIRGTV